MKIKNQIEIIELNNAMYQSGWAATAKYNGWVT